MKVMGIIAEYNPFHNGHAYQLRQAKERFQADAVVVAMSGDFTQRGTPAIFDKDTRAQMAPSCGADLVFELPAVVSTASAELFALGGVSLLHATGVVDELLFGCENEDLTLFTLAADALPWEDNDWRVRLRESLAAGNTYARSLANLLPTPQLAEFLSTPNNLLGVEYVRALRRLSSPIQPVCLMREGSFHHDETPSGKYSSASALRSLFFDATEDPKEVIRTYTPRPAQNLYFQKADAGEILRPEDVSTLLHAKLYEADDFSLYSDCSPALSARILRCRDQYVNVPQFCELLKSRDVTLARIRRMLCHILLNIKKEDVTPLLSGKHPPYLHILGFNETGARLLSRIKQTAYDSNIPLFLSAREADDLLSGEAARCFSLDLYAANLYRILLTGKTNRSFPTEYTKKFVPVRDTMHQ